MDPSKEIPLVKTTDYPDTYSPDLLFPVPRSIGRDKIGVDSEQHGFIGIDRWTGYELSWLSETGCPRVAIVEFDFDCNSDNIIESKSLKLYLNAFNQTVISQEALLETLRIDLENVCGGKVDIRLFDSYAYPVVEPRGYDLIDDATVACTDYDVNPRLLGKPDEKNVSLRLCSHLFRSLCPVTAQPDWASIYIEYIGPDISRQGLLAYLVSYRKHQGFHEQCVEMIFTHLNAYFSPNELTVFARFMRRGGLDINPYRTTGCIELNNFSRTSRQ